jgi:long-chain acyl-CoA synthetase
VGLPLQDVRVRIGEADELLVKGPNVMLGYWKNDEATRQIIDQDGWLHSGDKARIENGFIHITGRLKEIIVLANGEKVPPADMESAIAEDTLFEQSLLIGEGMPYLSALVVLNPDIWAELADRLGVPADTEEVLRTEPVEQALLERIAVQVRGFPGYAQIRRVTALLEPWTVDNGLATPTLKLKRARVMERFHEHVDRMYEGHVTI